MILLWTAVKTMLLWLNPFQEFKLAPWPLCPIDANDTDDVDVCSAKNYYSADNDDSDDDNSATMMPVLVCRDGLFCKLAADVSRWIRNQAHLLTSTRIDDRLLGEGADNSDNGENQNGLRRAFLQTHLLVSASLCVCVCVQACLLGAILDFLFDATLCKLSNKKNSAK